jgi:hypothetical protein
MSDEITAEQIAQHYSAAMDSVNLLNAGKPEDMSNEDWADTVSRNVEHLKIMVAKDLGRKMDNARFNLDQLAVGREAFVKMLADSLEQETE